MIGGEGSWSSARRRASVFLLAGSLFLVVAGLFVAPVVGDTHRSVTLVHGKGAPQPPGINAVVNPVPTLDPRTDDRPTAPPPADLGTVLVDLSGMGYSQVPDAAGAGPFDADHAVNPSDTPAGRAVRLGQLRQFGFRRGDRGFWRPAAGSPVVEVVVYEYETVSGAEDDLTVHEEEFEAQGASRVPLDTPAGGYGVTFDDSSDGKTFHNAEVLVQRGARLYVVEVSSSRLPADPKLAALIATQQAAKG